MVATKAEKSLSKRPVVLMLLPTPAAQLEMGAMMQIGAAVVSMM